MSNKSETPVEQPRLVRHVLPARSSPRFGEVPQCRVSIALPLILHIDCDDSMTDDQIKDLWQRALEDEVRIDIMGHGPAGAYHLRCNRPLPNANMLAPAAFARNLS